MRVVIMGEYSGRVRDAFLRRGHDAISVDYLPTEVWGPHHQGEFFAFIEAERVAGRWFDLMVAHPSCTDLAISGARWMTDHFVKSMTGAEVHDGERGYWHDGSAKRTKRDAAVEFVKRLWALPIDKVCLENPISLLSRFWYKPTQIIQPWQFGHGETKATCLWLRGLEPLMPTQIVDGREGRIWKLPPSPDRWKERSRTFLGIADAMAAQWG